MMYRQTLYRGPVGDPGAFGILAAPGNIPICITLERTFDDGRPLILPGVHTCDKSYFERGKYPTFEIVVLGHSRVLFHKANLETDLKGCIGLAFELGRLHNIPAVLQSGLGFDFWWSLVKDFDIFELEVIG